jgi:hypothetical protein
MIGLPHEWICPLDSKVWTWNLNDLYQYANPLSKEGKLIHSYNQESHQKYMETTWEQQL